MYRLAGDDDAAQRRYAAFSEALRRKLGVAPGAAVQAAIREPRHERDTVADPISIEAIAEAGSAAISAGATEAGIHSLRTAIRLADRADAARLRVNSRLVLAEALVHALGGLDEEGLAELHEADRIALACDDPAAAAKARAELGYVDFLRARYDRAERWLTDALKLAHGSPSILAKATAQCDLGRRHAHPRTKHWADTMRQLASRTGMRELIVRSMIHGAALGNKGDADPAALLAADIDNPVLHQKFPVPATR